MSTGHGLALAVVLLASTAAAQLPPPSAAVEGAVEVVVEVVLEPASITVGDPVMATLSVELPAAAAAAARFPDWSRGWGEAEVLEAGPVERLVGPGGEMLTQRLRLTAFRTGEVELPPVSIQWQTPAAGAARTPADLRLEVRSVLPAETEATGPLPAEAPRPLAVPRAALWTVGLLALAVLAAAWAARRVAVPILSAQEAELAPLPELAAALAALPSDDSLAGHRLLSSALRRYLGRMLGFPAIESTTREIERQLKSRHLEPAWVARGARVLREADQVKFARRTASAEELEQRCAEALAFGTAIEAHLHPAEPAAAGAA